MKKVLVFGITGLAGGTESVIMNYYRHFDAKKVHCDFLVNVEKPVYEDEIIKNGSKIFIITARSKNIKQYRKDLTAFFRKHAHEYDTIWVNLNSLTNIDYLKMAKKYGIKKRIVHAHNSSEKSKARLLFHYINKNAIDKYSTDFWACSKQAAQFFYPLRLKKSVKIINNAIDLKKFIFSSITRKNYRKILGISDKEIALVNVGRLDYQKNQSFLLKVLSELNGSRFTLYLIGDGEDRNTLAEEAERLKLKDSIHFLGSRSDVSEILCACDVFVFPSRYEGFGLATIEAAATGLPIFLSEAAAHNIMCIGLQQQTVLPIECSSWVSELAKLSIGDRESKSVENAQLIHGAGYDINKEASEIEQALIEK